MLESMNLGSELLVLNGLDYSVNNHSPCSRYMATGTLDSLAYPTFAALVAACQGPARFPRCLVLNCRDARDGARRRPA